MTYPDPLVAAELEAHFVRGRVDITRDRASAREARILWTPTASMWSRFGVWLREAIGFLPPPAMLLELRFARALDAVRSARFDQATALFQEIMNSEQAHDLAPEAAYWIGIASYLRDRDRAALRRAWQPLRERWPDSLWAARTRYEDESAR